MEVWNHIDAIGYDSPAKSTQCGDRKKNAAENTGSPRNVSTVWSDVKETRRHKETGKGMVVVVAVVVREGQVKVVKL